MLSNILNKKNALKNVMKFYQKPHFVNFTTCKPLFFTKYGGQFTVTMVEGIGFGPQLMKYVKEIFKSAKIPVNFEEVAFDHFIGNLDEVITAIRRNSVAIKANISRRDPDLKQYSQNIALLKGMNLFANVIHCKSEQGIKTRHKDVDILLISQNTEGEYSCLEHEIRPGIIESHKIITKEKAEEIARFAFKYAGRNRRKKILVAHNAYSMPRSDGFFIDVCEDVAKEYPDIEIDTISIDICVTLLVSRPQMFDVLLLPNFYGNVLNNIACGLVGGAGVVPGENYGHDCAVFEIASRSAASLDNPVAIVNASIRLLYYLGLETHAKILEDAIHRTINVDNILTPDLGGRSRAEDVVNRVAQIAREEVSIFKPLKPSV